MTRRLVVTIVATVLATLLVAGATTLVLAQLQARRATEADLREQAEALAVAAVAVNEGGGEGRLARAAVRRALRTLRGALRVDGVEFVRLDGAGRMVGTLPADVGESDLDVQALRRGETVAGANGSLVFAAAPGELRRAVVVAVVTRTATPGLTAASRGFSFAALATLGLGAVVAVLLARRLARPVEQASDVARRIAGGELASRLPEPPAADHDELAELARSLNTMAASLERSKVLDQQFLLSVSHDLRTPLSSIRGYAEAIVDGASREPRDAARVIVAESIRLDRLVTDLLDLARLDSRSFSLHPTVHDLRRPVADAVLAASPMSDRSGLSVTLDQDAEPVLVTADPGRVAQILANLLENACRYADTLVIVSVGSAAGRAIVTVDDDGPGIVPADVPHVFERLYVARHDPVRAEVGSGLGLAIVRQLAEAMGGSVDATASPTGGARIEVEFPLATAVSSLPDPPAASGRDPSRI